MYIYIYYTYIYIYICITLIISSINTGVIITILLVYGISGRPHRYTTRNGNPEKQQTQQEIKAARFDCNTGVCEINTHPTCAQHRTPTIPPSP